MDRAFLYEMFEWCAFAFVIEFLVLVVGGFAYDYICNTRDIRRRKRALRREYRNLRREIRREHAARKSLQRRLRRYERYEQI